MPVYVASNLLPKSPGKWPVVEDIYIRGGFRVVADAAARDAIYTDVQTRGGLKTGQLLVTANDKRIWQYDGVGVWSELKKSLTKTYSFSEPGNVWEVQHNTGSTHFTYSMFDTDGFQILPNECRVVDANTISFQFLAEIAGSVTISFNP